VALFTAGTVHCLAAEVPAGQVVDPTLVTTPGIGSVPEKTSRSALSLLPGPEKLPEITLPIESVHPFALTEIEFPFVSETFS
jgi:hypothetical protein